MSRNCAVSIALGLCLLCASAAAGPVESSSLSALALGQFGRSKAARSDRGEVEQLLLRARQAMKEGNFETADSLLTRAESRKVDFGLLHLGDTPKRLRRELDAKRSAAPQKGPRGEKLSATNDMPLHRPDPRAAAGADHAGRPGKLNPSDDARSLPSLDRADPSLKQSPFSRRNASTPPPDDDSHEPDLPIRGPSRGAIAKNPSARQQSDALLRQARRALAVGDIRRATAVVEQAKSLGAEYGFHDDSPAKVEALIRRHNDVSEVQAGRNDTPAARRQRADLLMEQAQQLMRLGEFDEAERLAHDAERLAAQYGPFDSTPDALLERIQSERKQFRGQTATTGAAPRAMPAMPPAGKEVNDPAVIGLTKDRVAGLLKQARAALAAGQADQAEVLARQAEALKLPEKAYAPGDDRPWMVLFAAQKARSRTKQVAAGKPQPAPRYPVATAGYDPSKDATRNRPAGSAEQDDTGLPQAPSAPNRLPAPDAGPDGYASEDVATPGGGPAGDAMRLFREGEQALRERNAELAQERFRQAYALRDQLDPVTMQRLQDHLQLPGSSGSSRPGSAPATLLDEAANAQQLAAKRLSADVSKQQEAARKLQQKDPKRAVELLKTTRANVQSANVEPEVRNHLLRRLDMSQKELDKYIAANRDDIELKERNKQVHDQVDRRQQVKVEIDDKLAKLVSEFNTLMDERRFPEAEVLAKRAKELDPDNGIVKQLEWQVKFVRRAENSRDRRGEKEEAMMAVWDSTEKSAIPFNDLDPLRFPDRAKWQDLTKDRRQRLTEANRRNERDLEIERKLKTPVSLKFRERPLSEVLNQLAKLAAVNLHLDPQGLAEEGVASDTPVTIDLTQDISLKSALNLILSPLHLNYVIKDEVLKITSDQLRDGEVQTVTYYVADLVIPIPDFVPSSRMGLSGALADAYGNLGVGGMAGATPGAPTTMLASQSGSPASAVINPAVLAQLPPINLNHNGGNSPPATGINQPIGFGPGGVGGGQQADFESLIELITTTVAPTTWDEMGGAGSIKEFETNLSLVISQTQEVHEQVADLLEQLRRNQDLQVTIEVRFITLNDNFFERIGVDFDFNIDDNVTVDPATLDDQGPSVTVGLQDPVPGRPFPNFTADLDIPFRQDSFTLATPQFGQPVDVARFGFAILSDIEAYFLVAAAQGDRRSNVLQAPKVTLFNGQQAIVSDTSMTPFVISVIPVVGDFAAAQQPVIIVLSEGTLLTVQAVVSSDRRFVRMTVVPFFSQIGDVEEFTFSGSKTTTKNTSDSNDGDDTSSSDEETTSTEGVTVQLPTFSFVTVTTTVSVPDGGTVLLGGIKRLSEGRNEFGVPILSKLPYINRLFKNVGIGRETQSLMMMVTPRIIIQEEEEERLGIAAPEP